MRSRTRATTFTSRPTTRRATLRTSRAEPTRRLAETRHSRPPRAARPRRPFHVRNAASADPHRREGMPFGCRSSSLAGTWRRLATQAGGPWLTTIAPVPRGGHRRGRLERLGLRLGTFVAAAVRADGERAIRPFGARSARKLEPRRA